MKIKNKLILPCILISLLPLASFAQASGSHGGNSIKKGNNFYLLDFAEAGVELNPKIRQDVNVTSKTTAKIEKIFPNNNSVPGLSKMRMQLAKKISEISLDSPLFSEILLYGIGVYSWNFIHFPITPHKDMNQKIEVPIYQTAKRENFEININADIFNRLSIENQVGLIFHEILYAFSYEQKNSDAIRPLVGLIFKYYFDEIAPKLLARFMDQAINSRIAKNGALWLHQKNTQSWSAGLYVHFVNIHLNQSEQHSCSIQELLDNQCNPENICSMKASLYNAYGENLVLGIFADTQVSLRESETRIDIHYASSFGEERYRSHLISYNSDHSILLKDCVAFYNQKLPLIKKAYLDDFEQITP